MALKLGKILKQYICLGIDVYYLVLPSKCGGSLATEHFAFRQVSFSNFSYVFASAFTECGVLPMLHVAGIGRFVVNRDLSVRLLTWLGKYDHVRFKLHNFSALPIIARITRRLKCSSSVCDFYGDVALLDVARFKYSLPIEFKVLPIGLIL